MIKDSDPLPKWLTVIISPFLSLQTFTVKQNLESWFLATSPPSSQDAGLMNKAISPFQPTLVSSELAFEWQAAKFESGSTYFSSIL